MAFVPSGIPVNVAVTDTSTAATSVAAAGKANTLMVTVVGANTRVYIAQGLSGMGAATIVSGECFLGSGQYLMNFDKDNTHIRAICNTGESVSLTVQPGNA